MRSFSLSYKYICTLLSLSLVATVSWGQQFGGNPFTLKWRQIKTDSLELIYPAGRDLDSTAQKVARLINSLQQKSPYELGSHVERVPILLQPLTTNTNGYVGLGPYRSEYFLEAPMDVMGLGSQDWSTTLALHEYRHVLQYNNINRGLTRTLDFFLGDNARSLFSDMAVPNWFFEGDAVANETRLSEQGRGRLPRFMNSYAVLQKDGKQYNYQQLRNGSYINSIPNHYNLGYLLVHYGYQQYGPDFWKKVIQDAAQYKGLFYPFQKAVKRVSGLSFSQFRAAAFKAYMKRYEGVCWLKTGGPYAKEGKGLQMRPLTAQTDKEVISYQYPYPAANNDTAQGIIALKTGRKKLSHFVYIEAGKEVNLGQAPITRDPYFGYHNGRIIYTRHKVDPRWRYKEYSDVEVLDIKTRKRKKITQHRRYFTPDISSSGQLIAAAELKEDGSSSILILNTTGQVLATCKAPKGVIYNYPKFYKKDSGVVFFIRQPDGQMGTGRLLLAQMSTASAAQAPMQLKMDTLLVISNRLISFPVVSGGKLYYSMIQPDYTDPYNVLMELDIEATNPKPKPIALLSSIRDIYQGYARNGSFIASLETSEGYGIFQLAKKEKDDYAQQPVAATATKASVATRHRPQSLLPGITDEKEARFGVYLSRQKEADNIRSVLKGGSDKYSYSDTITAIYFPVKRYPNLSHPFHFHSLQLAAEDPLYGLDLLGENILNTVQTSLAYRYNRVSEISSIGGDLSLGPWYVQPYVHMDYSWNYQAYTKDQQAFGYKELTSQLGLQLPLNFSGGRWQRSLYLSSAISQSNLFWDALAKEQGSPIGQIRYLYSRAQFTLSSRQAALQLFPRIGFSSYVELNTPLDDGPRQWMGSTTFYLPGIGATHSLRGSVAYQNRDTAGAYGYGSRFAFSRGYTRPSYARMWKFGVDYDLPIWYPDFGFAGLAYFFRVRANMYVDESYGFDSQKRRASFGSVGAALFTDLNIGNQYPITIGLRYNHLLNKAFAVKNNFELILPIKLL